MKRRSITTNADYFVRRELRLVCTYKSPVEDFLPQVSEIIPRLYLCDMYSATSSSTIERLGITHMVSVMKDAGYGFPLGIARLTIPVDDKKDVELWPYFTLAIHWIQHALNSSKDARVMVHCIWGKSRSASIVMAYLMATRRLTTIKAFLFVKKHRMFIQPNRSFVNQLLLFEEKLKNEEQRRVAQEERTEKLSQSLDKLISFESDSPVDSD